MDSMDSMFQFRWIIPVVFCILMMLFFFSRRMKGFGPRGFFNDEENKSKSSESAIDIINNRYAKGEINKEEYDRMKNDLS